MLFCPIRDKKIVVSLGTSVSIFKIEKNFLFRDFSRVNYSSVSWSKQEFDSFNGLLYYSIMLLLHIWEYHKTKSKNLCKLEFLAMLVALSVLIPRTTYNALANILKHEVLITKIPAL